MSAFKKHLIYKHKLALWVTLLAIVAPMIHFDGGHLLLFYFQENRFELMFHVFEVDTSTLLILFFGFAVVVILLLNFTFSRYFCGHLCPKTLLKNFFVDFIEISLFKIIKQKNIQKEELQRHPLKVLLAYLSLAMVALFAPLGFFFYFYPYDLFIKIVLSGFDGYFLLGALYLSIALYLFAEALFFKEFFCSYLCPYALVDSVTFHDKRDFYFFDDKEHCIECDLCVRVCPVPDLDIKKGFDSRCISCGDCSAVCKDVMYKEQREHSLINYKDSTKEKNKYRFFSFGSKKISIVLVIAVLGFYSIAASYLLLDKNLKSCRFSNSFLYENIKSAD